MCIQILWYWGCICHFLWSLGERLKVKFHWKVALSFYKWLFSLIFNWMGAGNMGHIGICVHCQCEKQNYLENWIFLLKFAFNIQNHVTKMFLEQKSDFLNILIFTIEITQCPILPAHAGNMGHLTMTSFWRHSVQTNNIACFINLKGHVVHHNNLFCAYLL